MNKKFILNVGLILAIVFIYFFVEQSRYISYSDLMTELIADEDDIIEIKISNSSHMQGRFFITTIDDQKLIEKIIQEPSMQLKKERKSFFPPTSSLFENTLYIITPDGGATFSFNESHIHLGVEDYKIVLGEKSPTRLYDLIREENLEWVEVSD